MKVERGYRSVQRRWHEQLLKNILPKLKSPEPYSSPSPAAPVSAPAILPHPISISVSSHCSITSPWYPPSQKTHWRPHSCLMLHPCPSQPAAPCWVKWSVLASGETRVLSSAQLSWAASVINLLCDYCQSETPPPRRSALMGTMSPGTASHGGWNGRAKEGIETGVRKGRGEGRSILLVGGE